jgi:hypothetical protein
MALGYAVVPAGQPAGGAHAPVMPSGAVLAGAGLVAAATIAGA